MTSEQQFFEKLLCNAGITINGQQAYDIKVHNENVFKRVMTQHALGLGEAYIEGWWDCPHLDKFFYQLLNARLDQYLRNNLFKQRELLGFALRYLWQQLQFRLVNYQKKARAFEVGEAHYDRGNDLFSKMLDKEMNYTCGYWKDATDLDSAQMAKLKLACDKLQLQKGQKVLDIGCGWGAFARYAAKHYGVSVVGVTISKEQKQLANELNKGLPIDIRLQDYRDVDETFDRVVSLGMFEHVGYKNYRTYMQVVNRCLKDDGLFLLHTIGGNATSYHANEWIRKYIFPNGMIPSITQIGKAIERLFIMEDWHNFGPDYDRTLMAWHENFNRHWDELKHKYDHRFFRIWNYYLLSCAGAFRARYMQLWQIVLSKPGRQGTYQSIR